MKSRAAILWGMNQEWKIEVMDVDPPKAGEVLVKWKAAGLCHSDEHMVTGDMVPPAEVWPMMGIENFYPILGGHEGAGIVAEVGSGVTSVAVGDHVSASFAKEATHLAGRSSWSKMSSPPEEPCVRRHPPCGP